MFSRQEREAGVYYGADQGPLLEFRWEPAVDAMIGQFRAGEFTAGVIDGLDTLTIGSLDPSGPLAPSDPPGPIPESPAFPVTDGGGSGFPTTAILLLVLVLAGVAAVTVGRQWVGGSTGSSSNWWSGSRRYRSFGSFGSSFGHSSRSSHSSHSSSSSHSSGGGAHRSGGGSKRW